MTAPQAVLRCVLALVLTLMLTGCSAIDARQQEICEALVPVLEPGDVRVILQRVGPGPDPARDITIQYRIAPLAADEPGTDSDSRLMSCRFAGSGFDEGKLQLLAVETRRGPLSATQITFLNRHWLNDEEAQSLGRHALTREGEATPRGWVTLSADGGYFAQQIVNAGPPTALYALLALAYSLVYGLTNRINLAFGEIATIGAYGALIGVALSLGLGDASAGMAVPLALLFAVVLAGWAGALIGTTVFSPLLGRSSQPLLVSTIGLAIAIQEFLARSQGVRERWLQPILAEPHLIADGPFDVVTTTMQLLVTCGAGLVVLAVIAAMRLSRFGRMWRAVADDRLMARMVGINVHEVVIASFVIASGLAALGGSILTLHYGGTSFAMGTTIGLKALVAAIIGGIGSLPGAALGGLVLGLVEALWSAYEPIVWRDGVVFTLMIVFLVLRPAGLLGTRRALEERDERP